MLTSYLKQIADTKNRGDAREESYYSALSELLGGYARSTDKGNVRITTLPKKTEAGNPDFRVWDGNQHITGYIEAKDPSVGNLDRVEDTEQLKRYRHTFPNLILTNFLEFRLYRDGVLTDKVVIGRPVILHKLKAAPPLENEPQLLGLLQKFFSFSVPRVYDAKTLAVELAKRTRFLKDAVALALDEENNPGRTGGVIRGFYAAFHEYLIKSLTEAEFSDLYAQTVTYGLFAARTRSENGFNRKLAYDNIPQTIGILRDVFQFVSLGSLPPQMEWIIDDISEVLSVTDTNRLLHQYFHDGKGKDPIVHFYETFLSEYDPKAREMRGVYYTPEPVVSYIVRSLHGVLKEDFNKPDGFADRGVTVLDPAAGTLTFLAETAKLALDEFVSKYGEGGKEEFIKEHVLKDFYAFELMMAPYAVGHLKMSFLLEELGYRLHKDDRVKLYLTNTLDMSELEETMLPGMSSLSYESHLAGKVKKEQPVLVILGNPPYSGHSVNVYDEVKAYYKVDGKPLGEKNPKWLQDDYVKFIRFAEWKIGQAGEGVLGFITNHSYLDNPTFRGMRQSLMTTFDEMRILDLHGNSLKKERCPDGTKDENVFDIQQGVAIAIFIKKRGKKKAILHADLWGDRGRKYSWLKANDIKTTKWKPLKPKPEFYLLIPRDERLLKGYEKYPKVTDIFPVNSVGVVTSRDNFAVDFEEGVLKRRVMQFRDKKMPDDIIGQAYGLKDKANWSLHAARQAVMEDDDWEQAITKILYRPFDERWIYYHDAVIERSRKEVMRHMLKENLGLITNREVNGQFRHAFCADKIINDCAVSSLTRERSYLFPLYLYVEANKPKKKRTLGATLMLFEPAAPYFVKKPNIDEALIKKLAAAYKKEPSPEETFHYIYAVLYSETYRKKYAQFLRTDFPRVPFTKDYGLFTKMSGKGERLCRLHLLNSPELDTPVARFQGKGDKRVAKPVFDEKAGRIYINDERYFEGVSPEVWGYKIGGYQVSEKWLKDRKEKELSLDESQAYCRVLTSIQKTMGVQKSIDEDYDDVEGTAIS